MKRICSITALIYLLGLLPVAVFGQLGSYALRFDGTDDYVSIPHNAAFNVSAVTIEMWFKWENYTTPADVDFLIGKDFEQLEIHTGGGAGNNALRFIPTTGVYLDTPPNSFVPGNWYHVAYIYNPAGATKYACYINGSPVSLTAIGTVTTAIYTSTEPLKIGIRKNLETPFQGYIDEVRIWNTARTQAEIQAAQNSELTGNETGLVAYYKMNEGTGTSADDASSNSNTGTLMSGVAWSRIFYLVNDLTSGLTGMPGGTFKWYSSSANGTLYAGTESLVNGQIYYAAQVVNGVESADRKAVTANIVTQAAPTAGTHTPAQTQIVWNWNAASGATGYKWNTTNDYNSATDVGTANNYTQTGLTCGTGYTLYVWAYNTTTGCVSAVAALTQTTSSCMAAPALSTSAVSNIGSTTATLNGNITSVNGANATTRGFKYSTTNGFDPATSGTNLSENGSFGTGAFTANISGLSTATTYYVRAYATNSVGTTYGDQLSFTTLIQTDFSYTGSVQTFTVPAGVTSVTIEAWGAQGWSGTNAGGLGGYAKGTLSVTQGQTLYVYVGGQGSVANVAGTPMGGGWNGGGNGQDNGTVGNAGGGGGASDIRSGGTALGNRVIVAGGGGGSTNNSSCAGGNGGGLAGIKGGGSYSGGYGGTQTEGGSFGGSLGQGGNAIVSYTPWNGGGGGGYYGGGTSDAHGSGGGGSSYIGGVTNGTTTAGQKSGNGRILISY